MSNIVFCRPGARVTVRSPGTYPDTFFWFIATHRRLDFFDLRGEALPTDELGPLAAPFRIREEDVRRLERGL